MTVSPPLPTGVRQDATRSAPRVRVSTALVKKFTASMPATPKSLLDEGADVVAADALGQRDAVVDLDLEEVERQLEAVDRLRGEAQRHVARGLGVELLRAERLRDRVGRRDGAHAAQLAAAAERR